MNPSFSTHTPVLPTLAGLLTDLLLASTATLTGEPYPSNQTLAKYSQLADPTPSGSSLSFTMVSSPTTRS